MPRSAINTVAQTIEVTDVVDIEVTTAELDPDTGDYVREIRILGEPNGANGLPVFVLRMTSPVRENINVTAPEQQF